MATYCYPRLGRAGLGNCMLTWARAVAYARTHHCEIIAPRWVQPRLGALIRRERVKRFYFGEFTNHGYIKGPRKHWLLLTQRHEAEEELTTPDGRGAAVRVFEGLKKYFDDIKGHAGLIRSELRGIVNPTILARVDEYDDHFIAVNMRRGDLTNIGWSEERLNAEPRYTPTSWFVAALATVACDPRWRSLPIYLISDGTDAEIAPLLDFPACQFVTTGSAVGDILLMAKSRMLVASGHSTFSMWASYLGEMPTLYYPGKMQQSVFTASAKAFEGEWSAGSDLPPPLR